MNAPMQQDQQHVEKKPDRSPHCEGIWPGYDMADQNVYQAAKLLKASSAAETLIQLLVRDDQMRTDQEDSEDMPPPFTSLIRGGLLRALSVCIDQIEGMAEHQYDAAVKEVRP